VTDGQNAALPRAMADAIRVLLRTYTISERAVPDHRDAPPYNGLDFQTLHFVSANPGCKASDLVAFLCVSATTAQSVIERLIKRDWLARTPHATDKRAVALALTPIGQTMRRAIDARDHANSAAMLAALSASEQRQFVDQLARIARAVDLKAAS
jgi:DNA-binding MarR family transcriptional regulator